MLVSDLLATRLVFIHAVLLPLHEQLQAGPLDERPYLVSLVTRH